MMETQRVYLPFQLAEGREIKDPIPYSGEVAGYAAELKRNEPYYTMELSRIPSEQEATTQFKKLIVAFYWMALNTQAGLLMQQELQAAFFPPDPIRAAKNMFGQNTDRKADVIINGGSPAIWPDDKQVVKVTGQPVGLIMSYSPPRVFEILNEGMKLPNPDAVLENLKLKLAIDLYCLSHFRSSHFARFLVLWTALETAAPALSLSASVTDLIDKWIKETRDAQSNIAHVSSGEHEQLDSILGSLNYIKKQSHGIRTRQYVKGTSKNCYRSSGAPNLPANDSALFSFRFCAVHPKDVRDCQLQ